MIVLVTATARVALAPDWDADAVGAAPTIVFDSGLLTITDAAKAPSGADGKGDSWIYDLDTDKGNQMVWKAPIGKRDFNLQTTFSWASNGPELTYAGVALVNADGVIETHVGYNDGSAGDANLGVPWAAVRVAGPDADKHYAGTGATQGTQTMSIRRTGDQLVIRSGDQLVLEHAGFTADIEGLALYSVRYYKASGTAYDFGTVSFDRVSLCF